MATYLITDAYFKEQYPLHKDLDMSKFYATLLIEQQTTIEDIIGEVLYGWLIENAATIASTDVDQYELLKQVKYLLVLLVARVLIPLEEKSKENAEYSDRIQTLENKIAYLRAKLIRFIAGSDTLLEIVGDIIEAEGGGAGQSDDTFNPEDEYYSPIYYWR